MIFAVRPCSRLLRETWHQFVVRRVAFAAEGGFGFAV